MTSAVWKADEAFSKKSNTAHLVWFGTRLCYDEGGTRITRLQDNSGIEGLVRDKKLWARHPDSRTW